MSGPALLETGLLLGLYVLLAGGWGVLYALARVHGSRALRSAAAAAFGMHALFAVAIVLWAPLGPGWKLLILASTAVLRSIPPVVWRFLQQIHGNRGSIRR